MLSKTQFIFALLYSALLPLSILVAELMDSSKAIGPAIVATFPFVPLGYPMAYGLGSLFKSIVGSNSAAVLFGMYIAIFYQVWILMLVWNYIKSKVRKDST